MTCNCVSYKGANNFVIDSVLSEMLHICLGMAYMVINVYCYAMFDRVLLTQLQ